MIAESKLLKAEGDHLVGYVRVNASKLDTPIYLNDKFLYVRVGSSNRPLRGESAAKFVLQRARGITEKNAKLADAIKTVQPKTGDFAVPGLSASQPNEVKAIVKTVKSSSDSDIAWNIVVYSDGKAAKKKRLNSDEPVMAACQLAKGMMKKNGRLLMCYANGRMNVVTPKDIVSDKLVKRDYRYGNGVCMDSPLMGLYACTKDDYILLEIKDGAGQIWRKAMALSDFASHGAMQAKGNMVVHENAIMQGAKIDAYKVVKAEDVESIRKYLVKKTDLGLGIAV